MLEITFKINGRRVRPNQIANALERAILEGVEKQIKTAVSSVRCPEHGQAARITVKGRDLNNLTFDVHGCCSGLVEQVKRKLQ